MNRWRRKNIWDRYFEQLARIARSRLSGVPGQATDDEDVALSALNSFFNGARAGRFPDLQDRTGLWPLLLTITSRKAINQVKHQQAQKRTKKAEQYVPDLALLISKAPTPEFAVEMAEQTQALLDRLEDQQLRNIAVMKLEGYTNAEIAAHMQIALRSVSRKLVRIRIEWQEYVQPAP